MQGKTENSAGDAELLGIALGHYTKVVTDVMQRLALLQGQN
jgi:hypothetical protein